MKLKICCVLVALIWVAISVAPLFAVRVGETAPDFTEPASDGHSYELSDFRGKFVVLEWHNNKCPWTRKHYESGNMQRLQKEWTSKGVVWFTVISSAPGKGGYVTPDQENAYLKRMNAVPTAVLLDPSGKLGHLYEAKNTPTMVLISPSGVILYYGAIDNRPTTDLSDITGATNYISQALTEALAGKPVSIPTTKPYGCAVRYADNTPAKPQ